MATLASGGWNANLGKRAVAGEMMVALRLGDVDKLLAGRKGAVERD